jgi:hypothetical protein
MIQARDVSGRIYCRLAEQADEGTPQPRTTDPGGTVPRGLGVEMDAKAHRKRVG